MRVVTLFSAILATLTLGLGTLRGQGLTAQISGTVRDATGSNVPGAKLELRNTGTGQTRDATADPLGNFVFLQLLPGTYQLGVTAAGFKRHEQRDIVLTATERLVLHEVVLEIGELSQSISVAAEAARIQTQSAERAGLISTSQIQQLSMKGRDWLGLLSLLPGVIDTANREAPGENTLVGISINGLSTRSMNLTLDGISTLNSGSMYGPYFSPSLDAVAEVKVLLVNYQAEYGRASAGTINAIIRAGTKDFHGGAYYFKRNEALNANEYFNNRDGLRRPYYRYDYPGFNLGGPLLIPGLNMSRERLFFFWSEEFLPRKTPTRQGRLTFPTELERAGDFSRTVDTNGAVIPVLDPLNNRQPFPANIVPPARIDKNGQGLLKLFPLPNTADPRHTFNYVFQRVLDHPRRDHILRVDWNISPKSTFYARGILDYDATKGDFDMRFVSSVYPQFPNEYRVSARGLVGTLIHTFNPTLVNESTFGVNRSLQLISPLNQEALDRNDRTKLGLNLPQFHPEINPLNLIPNATFGGVQSAPSLSIETRFPFFGTNNIWNWSDNLSKVWGTHNVKVGTYIERTTRNAAAYTSGFNGNFNFGRNVNNPFDVNYAFANALLGSVNSYTEPDRRPDVHGRFLQVEWFAQDNWRLHRRVTLDVGARFYRIGAVSSRGDRLSTFVINDYDQKAAPVLVAPYRASPGSARLGRNPITGEVLPEVKIGTFAPGSGNIYNGMRVFKETPMKTPGVKVAPRIGFAWDLFGNGKTALRGGFGIFFDRYWNDVVVELGRQPPVVNTSTAHYTTIKDLLATPLSLSPTSVLGVETDNNPITVYNWSFGVQRSLGFGAVADVAYVGCVGRHLLQTRNLNATPYGTNFLPTSLDPTLTGNRPLPTDFLRPFRGFADINYQEFGSTQNYHSMQTQVSRRLAENLTFGASWTWSKEMDLGQGGTVNPFLDFRMRNYGKGAYDRTHNFRLSYHYRVPNMRFAGNRPVSRWILHHWEVSGITSFTSGAPAGIGYGFVQAVDITGAAGSGVDSRVILTGNPNLPKSERTRQRHFRTEVVRPPDPSNFGIGNAPKDAVRGPGLNNWDISVFKNFPLGKEGPRRLEFRGEMYNAFNHVQFSGLDATARFDQNGKQVNGRFGEYTSNRDARRIQVGLKLYF